MPEEFISEEIRPTGDLRDASALAIGAPAPPAKFVWRGREYVVAAVLDAWKETGADRGGSDERYVRRHWFRIRTDDGAEMKIYFERQARSGRQARKRWWLYTMLTPG
jgi:Domain of unknown function (DUF6504)